MTFKNSFEAHIPELQLCKLVALWIPEPKSFLCLMPGLINDQLTIYSLLCCIFPRCFHVGMKISLDYWWTLHSLDPVSKARKLFLFYIFFCLAQKKSIENVSNLVKCYRKTGPLDTHFSMPG